MTLRNYSNTSVQTTLAGGIDAAVTALTVADATGYPVVPFAIVVDPDVVASEEAMLVTAAAGPLFTVQRAYDGTTAKAHSAGATVIHAGIGADFRERVIPSTYATGSLTIATQPTVGDTITVGPLTYTFIDTFPNPGEIFIDVDLATTQANTVTAIGAGIGATTPDAGALPFSANVSILVSKTVGTAGAGVVTTGVFADGANHFDQPALTGGTDGSTTGHVQANTGKFTGESTANNVLTLQAAPGMAYASSVANIFQALDKDGNSLIEIDSAGNFYTLRDLRMDDPSHNAIFIVGQDKTIFIRFADQDDAFRVFMESKLLFALRPFASVTALINAHAAGAVALEIDTAGLDNTDLIQARGNVGFDLVFRLMQGGAVVIAQHVAPADADIATGQMALWFDQTPGAAAAMFKAKDSDGTVVAASVPLT